MKSISIKMLTLLAVLLFSCSLAYGGSVKITEPPEGAVVSSPVKVCMSVDGIEVEPAKKGVNKGKVPPHLLIDVDLPADLTKPVGKDAQAGRADSGLCGRPGQCRRSGGGGAKAWDRA